MLKLHLVWIRSITLRENELIVYFVFKLLRTDLTVYDLYK